MKVTYIAHSGFAVETSDHRLIFDYFRGSLDIPDDGRTAIFFVSHFHEDHYNRDIYSYAQRADTYYVLSREIKGAPPEAAATYVRPDCEYEIGGVRIRTLRSTDCGVAYLVFADGDVIYHAGDLHLWVWDGAPAVNNTMMEHKFCAELEKLRGTLIDAAFLPLDQRQGEDGTRGFDYAMRNLEIKKAFPMHFWGDSDYVEMFLQSQDSIPYRDRIVPLTKEGAETEI